MSQVIFNETICAECSKTLPKFSVAEIITPDFIVCVECYEETESQWAYMQELLPLIKNGECDVRRMPIKEKLKYENNN
jgi:uncharacterized protein with PIN domain